MAMIKIRLASGSRCSSTPTDEWLDVRAKLGGQTFREQLNWSKETKRSQGEPGGARRSQEDAQKQAGGARRSLGEPGEARRSQEQPGGARRSRKS